MLSLLEKTRKVTKVLQLSGNNAVSFSELCKILSEVLNTNVYIASRSGKLLGYSFAEGFKCELNIKTLQQQGTRFPEEFNKQLLEVIETKSNIIERSPNCVYNHNEICKFNERFTTIVPVNFGGKRLGTIVLARFNNGFNEEDLVLAEYSATVVGMEILRAKNEEIEEDARHKAVVQMAIGTLSYSELEAVGHIFKELNGNEGLLVASKIADKVGITRSVIVNALRKFESAGVIETRSLGMKGTFIKVLNSKLLSELTKIN